MAQAKCLNACRIPTRWWWRWFRWWWHGKCL